jgi:2-polyprenyl-3-methyl-5-hydroxy-6-metoxy-1,4-benzoquinol methylase
MPLLKPKEYNASYFDGKYQSMRHNAGYTTYERWFRNDSNNFLDIAKDLVNQFSLENKKVLDVGCAKGFLVEDLRSLGVDAFGIDISSYAISKANLGVSSYLELVDVRNKLQDYKDKEFELLISMNFLCCFSDEDLYFLSSQFNRISNSQFHVVNENENTNFYNSKKLVQWVNEFNWNPNTKFSTINGYSLTIK